METLADRIAARRRALGLSQSALASIAGVSREAVSQWERGETKNLKLDHLFAIADALLVGARWLALGKGPMKAAMVLALATPPFLSVVKSLGCILCQMSIGTVSLRTRQVSL